jgi:hypothetical protein
MFQLSRKSMCYAAMIAMVVLSGVQQPGFTREKKEHDASMLQASIQISF